MDVYNDEEIDFFFSYISCEMDATLGQRITALPRELQIEIVSHVGDVSMAIARFVVFKTNIQWSVFKKRDLLVVYTSGFAFFEWMYQRDAKFINYYSAAKAGDKEIVRFLIAQQLAFGQQPKKIDLCGGLAAGGHLELLKVAIFNGIPWDEIVYSKAARFGHIDVLKYARKSMCPWSSDVCEAAAKGGHLGILKWARKNGCSWNSWVCAAAALNGHLETLKWLRFGTGAEQCPWDETVCANAAERGHLKILKWARSMGCPWNADACAEAAFWDHFEVLKWLRENDCPWDSRTYENACMTCNLDMIEWLKANGCPEV
jgi:hypothetical protein